MGDFEFLYKLNPKEFCKQSFDFIIEPPVIVDIFERKGSELQTLQHLRYFKEPKIRLDLNQGLENHILVDDQSKHTLAKVENFIIKNDLLRCGNFKGNFQIYTRRHVLQRIMLIPHTCISSLYKDGTILATKCNGSLYLSRSSTDFSNNRQDRNSIYPYKFRQCCFADSATAEPDMDAAFDENKHTYAIYHSQWGNFKILYSGEVEGVLSDHNIQDLSDMEELNKCRFVMTKLLKPGRYPWKKQPKMLNAWIQAYLGKVADIFVGLIDQDGFVNCPVESVSVEELPNGLCWKPRTSMNFLYQYLCLVQGIMEEVNCPYTVYEFRYDSLKNEIWYKVHSGKTDMTFLTEDFIRYVRGESTANVRTVPRDKPIISKNIAATSGPPNDDNSSSDTKANDMQTPQNSQPQPAGSGAELPQPMQLPPSPEREVPSMKTIVPIYLPIPVIYPMALVPLPSLEAVVSSNPMAAIPSFTQTQASPGQLQQLQLAPMFTLPYLPINTQKMPQEQSKEPQAGSNVPQQQQMQSEPQVQTENEPVKVTIDQTPVHQLYGVVALPILNLPGIDLNQTRLAQQVNPNLQMNAAKDVSQPQSHN